MPDTSQDIASQWKSFDEGRRTALLAKMTPEQKKNLRAELSSNTPPGGQFKTQDEKANSAAPVNARFPSLGPTGYKAADFVASLLPGAGATVGGMAGSGLASVPLAGVGGAAGALTERLAQKALYKDLPDESAKDLSSSMMTQAILGAGSEGLAQGASGFVRSMVKPFTKSAESASSGIRMTAGESSGSKLIKTSEGVLEHLPGGASVMEKFRAAQGGDVDAFIERQMDAISQNKGLSDEEVGKQVQSVVKQARNAANESTNEAYAAPKRLLGLKPDATREEIEAAIAEKAKPQTSLLVDPKTGKPVVTSGEETSEATRKYAEAKRIYRENEAKFDQNVFAKILSSKRPELVSAYMSKSGLEDLRMLNRVMPPEVKQNAARSVFQNIVNKSIDAQTGDISPKVIANGLKDLGEGRGRLIFGNQYDAIKQASEMLNKLNVGSGEMAGRMHMARMMMGGATALASLFTGVGALVGGAGGAATGAATAIAGEYGFSRLLAEALTRPQYTAKALNVVRGMAVAAARGIPYVADAGAQQIGFNPSPAILPKYTQLPVAQ